LFDGAAFCFGVEAFDVAGAAGVEVGFDEDFVEVVFADDLASEGAEGLGGGDEGAERDDAGVAEEPGDFGGAAEVFAAVVVAEAEAAVEACAEEVAVEESGEVAFFVEGFFDGGGEGAFAGAAEAVEPEDGAALSGEGFAGGAAQEADRSGREVFSHGEPTVEAARREMGAVGEAARGSGAGMRGLTLGLTNTWTLSWWRC